MCLLSYAILLRNNPSVFIYSPNHLLVNLTTVQLIHIGLVIESVFAVTNDGIFSLCILLSHKINLEMDKVKTSNDPPAKDLLGFASRR
jgi:hypothetical protein